MYMNVQCMHISFLPQTPLPSRPPHISQQSFLCSTVSFLLQFASVKSLSPVRLFATPWTAAHQASLSIQNPRSLLKLISTESVMPSNHLILCHQDGWNSTYWRYWSVIWMSPASPAQAYRQSCWNLWYKCLLGAATCLHLGTSVFPTKSTNTSPQSGSPQRLWCTIPESSTASDLRKVTVLCECPLWSPASSSSSFFFFLMNCGFCFWFF